MTPIYLTVTVNFHHEQTHDNLEIQDVGIEWAAYILRSRTINTSNIVQLRVKALHPKGPAHSSGRIRVGDRLVSIDGEEVMGQAAALQIAKVNGPSGPPS